MFTKKEINEKINVALNDGSLTIFGSIDDVPFVSLDDVASLINVDIDSDEWTAELLEVIFESGNSGYGVQDVDVFKDLMDDEDFCDGMVLYDVPITLERFKNLNII